MHDVDPIGPGPGAREIERRHHVDRLHRRRERPRQDVARVVIEDGRQVVPAPAHDVQVREIRLPELVGAARGMGKPIGRLEHDEGAGLVIRSAAFRMR